MSEMRPQGMHELFGWTERPFSKSNRRVSATIIVFVEPNDPSMLCDRFMDPFLYSFCYRLIVSRVSGIVCVVLSTISFSNHGLCLDKYSVSHLFC